MWHNTFTAPLDFDLAGFIKVAEGAGVKVTTEKRNLGLPPHFTAITISGSNKKQYEDFVYQCKKILNLDTERVYKDLDHS